MKTNIKELTQTIIDMIPTSLRFNAHDEAVFQKFKPFHEKLSEKFVKGFYDILFGYPTTQSIFKPDERPLREPDLQRWWQRTITGPFDINYWSWQAAVGVIHIKRKVKNPMMISIWGWILLTLQKEFSMNYSLQDTFEAMDSWHRLAITVESLIAESYLHNYIVALAQSTGTEFALLDRLVAIEVADIDPKNLS
ncbi:globin [Candidatus Methylacidiphilum fumarolicum]|uniref:Globin domain n=2 Tax=Candidatus Methylacidiphilum fumarolicum TaxID=591154 RepID=I0JY39_METFB|nr:protoglobin domain-containing protein [Candidatus Methylacidiphilum fumarolicum]MBW6415570.1 globin [Candidatus Methylacidiphilum fumarolicum]TFE68469.1 globin [Candidatus Methylacidiphilum fumarolicum]TFE73076.1 globin [Candidatus Methylacidiphilum fumarolicum]TFE73133.1 globin [Candidatus Methylacidiphilum fumarolicum]TFE77109.1 globin [Candidatus Methylacidiphilum fumarolicum]